MTMLVTGATGFVGSHVLDELIIRGEHVRALIRDESKAEGLRNRGVEVVVGDLLDRQVLTRAVQGVQVVYHCAAAVGPRWSEQEIVSANRDGVQLLLEESFRAGYPRVVLLSSVNVLGTRDLDAAAEDLPCCRSNDPAADVKIEMEQLALEQFRDHNLNVVILRPGLIYGPRDRHNLPRLIEKVRQGTFPYLGSTRNVVPLVHASDVVQAMLLAAEKPRAIGRIYHITDGSRTTIGEFVETIAEALKCPTPRARVIPLRLARALCGVGVLLGRWKIRRWQPVISPAALRFLGTSRFIDIRRAREELGYSPRVDLRDGIAATIGWIEEHSHESNLFAHSTG